MKKISSLLLILFTAVFAVSCTNDEDFQSAVGYVKLSVNTVTATLNRSVVPENYQPKQLYVEFVDENGEVVKSTADLANDNEYSDRVALMPGTYTINVHSNGWDGDGSAFGAAYYYGTSSVVVESNTTSTAKVTCKLANVQVDVVYDESIHKFFTDGETTVTSGSDELYPLDFKLNESNRSAYFPADKLGFKLSLVNKKGVRNTAEIQYINDVKACEHYTITYSLDEKGWIEGEEGMGNITVRVNDDVNTYTFDIQVATESKVSFTAKTPTSTEVTASSAKLTADFTTSLDDFSADKIGFEYRQSSVMSRTANDWTSEGVVMTVSDGVASAQVSGLEGGTSYEGRFTYPDGDNVIYSNIVKFATLGGEQSGDGDPKQQIYNAGFENWYKGSNKAFYANEEGTSYWDSSNPGSSSFNVNVTNQETSFVHGGSSSAKLGSKYVVIKFAAASLFTGSFVKLIGTSGAELLWGVPFTSRPSALKGYLSYNAPAINRVGKNLPDGAPAKDDPDEAQIFCALLTDQLKVANASNNDGYEISMDIDWQNDPRVIAYGELTKNNSSNGQWEEFSIPLVYHNADAIPAYMLIVCSSSKYGDYFHGADSSVLYLDDFEFVYGERTVR